MESFFSRYRNASLLVLVLVAQVVGLGTQVKRSETGGTRLIRFWVVNTVTPIEKFFVGAAHGVRNVSKNYVYLRGVRQENRDLKAEVERLRIERVRLSEDAAQAHRLQALLGFKEQFVSQTVAAQVIGTSGVDQSHVVYIDRGSSDGIKPDMAVITGEGVVGKVLRVFHASSQVLLINDSSSGVGAILESSRLQGILQGTAAGEITLKYVMSDEKVVAGEPVLTSGGDRIFPKGLPIGVVQQANPGSDLFLNIRVKPGANLSRLEEVLVVTSIAETNPKTQASFGQQVRAADILAERLPSVPPKPAGATPGTKPANAAAPSPSAPTATAAGTQPPAGATPEASATKPPAQPAGNVSPAGATGKPADSGTNKPAVVKPAVNKPAAGDGQKPKINSAGQPAKPAAAPPQTPGGDVSR